MAVTYLYTKDQMHRIIEAWGFPEQALPKKREQLVLKFPKHTMSDQDHLDTVRITLDPRFSTGRKLYRATLYDSALGAPEDDNGRENR